MKTIDQTSAPMHRRHTLMSRTSKFALLAATANIVSALPAFAACGPTLDVSVPINNVNIQTPYDCVRIHANVANNVNVDDDIVGWLGHDGSRGGDERNESGRDFQFHDSPRS